MLTEKQEELYEQHLKLYEGRANQSARDYHTLSTQMLGYLLLVDSAIIAVLVALDNYSEFFITVVALVFSIIFALAAMLEQTSIMRHVAYLNDLSKKVYEEALSRSVPVKEKNLPSWEGGKVTYNHFVRFAGLSFSLFILGVFLMLTN